MTSPEFWSQVRAQRDAQQPDAPHDRPLWVLVKPGRRVEAVVRTVAGVGDELRILVSGDLRWSQLFRDDDALQAASIARRAELEAAGWQDPSRLEWGR